MRNSNVASFSVQEIYFYVGLGFLTSTYLVNGVLSACGDRHAGTQQSYCIEFGRGMMEGELKSALDAGRAPALASKCWPPLFRSLLRPAFLLPTWRRCNVTVACAARYTSNKYVAIEERREK
jgi:hypothetical protein